MFRTKAAAEKAAIEGRGPDWDTQQCLQLQGDILSSSPPHGAQDASRGEATEEEPRVQSHPLSKAWETEPQRDIEGLLEQETVVEAETEPVDAQIQSDEQDPPPDSAKNDNQSVFLKTLRSQTYIRRDREGKLRPLDSEGNLVALVETPGFRQQLSEMEDLSQNSMSAMSPTQENSQSAYQQYELQHKVPDNALVDGSEQVDEDTAVKDPQLARQHHSAVTDSTAHTYEENETGHVEFDIIQVDDENPEADDGPISQSQDASFAPRAPQEEHSYPQFYEPQTPAQPVNPFTHKGSVMKGHEMFGATQPSSIGRQIGSATSSRPSPDIYNNFTSPVKHMQSSPLPGRLDGNETSPLQKSVRHILRGQSMESPLQTIPRTSGVQSFNSDPRIQPKNKAREARPYESMTASQERRSVNASSPDSGSELEDSDDDAPRKRFLKKKIDEKVRKELIGVAISKRATSTIPASSSQGTVEVPSTVRRGRRRSTQEDYVAQCEGRDARDTEPDDVIADSQAVPTGNGQVQQPIASSTLHPSWPESTATDGMNKPASPNLPLHPTTESNIPELDQSSTTDNISSPPKDPGSPFQQPSLPLQEVHTNFSDLRTPVASKLYSDAADTMVPETSPADLIKPMGGITSISFSDETQQNYEGLPGFASQKDFDEFEEALQIGSGPSPDPFPKKREAPRIPSFPNLAPPAGLAEISADSNDRASPSESVVEVIKAPAMQTSTEQSAPHPDNNEVAADETAVGSEDETQDITQDENTEINPEAGEKPGAIVDEHGVNMESSDNPNVDGDDNAEEADEVLTKSPKATSKTSGLRSKNWVKGPSKTLPRAVRKKPLKTYTTPRQPSRVAKTSSTTNPSTSRSSRRASIPKLMSTPLSSLATMSSPSLKSSPTKSVRRSTRKSVPTREETPMPTKATSTKRKSGATAKTTDRPTPIPAPAKPSAKRKSASNEQTEPVQPTRSSKRQSMPKAGRDNSADPRAGPTPSIDDGEQTNHSMALFTNMSFAVSYKDNDKEKGKVMHLIKEQGGQILADGFDSLFDLKRANVGDGDNALTLSPAATRVGFAALIADEHSRRAKYMQALALGLPCISGRWIITCVSKGEIVNWAPYLLCAGNSTFLGNAVRSRTLRLYDATTANFSDTFANRERILDGKSVLLVEGKGRAAEEKRKAYSFLAQAVGPARFDKVSDLEQARAKLLKSEEDGIAWDLLYVDHNETLAESVVFGSAPVSSGSKKRKRGPVATEEVGTPAPKKIRIINDEVVIQSLIIGQLLEE